MKDEQAQVALFHQKKLGSNHQIEWNKRNHVRAITLAEEMDKVAKVLLATGEIQHIRTHLMLEELSEFILAETEVDAFDALIDLLYVTLGTFECYNMPAFEGFQEVHRSNMSKKPTSTDRVTDKGERYSPPELKKILDYYRQPSDVVKSTDLTLQARKVRAKMRKETRRDIENES